MSMPLSLRAAQPHDADAIAILLGQLGYPATRQQTQERLGRFGASPACAVFVACQGAAVCGLATVHCHSALNADTPAAQLTLLVVDERLRGSGAGRRLVERAESWARQQGAIRLVVSTAVHRSGAHAFYEHLGYTLTGRRYARALPDPDA